MTRIVIIGNGPAAIRALQAISTCKIRLPDSKVDVTVVSAERCPPYSPMFLVDYVTGDLQMDQITLREAPGLAHRRIEGEKVSSVCDCRNVVILETGKEIPYDRLLVASGASPFVPAIKGIEKEGVFFLNRLADAERLSPAIRVATKAIVIGAGMIGVEAAIAFRKMGRDVVVVEALDSILPGMLDKELADHAERRLCSLGIEFMKGTGIFEIAGSTAAKGVVAGDRVVDGDLILVAAGVAPNVGFLRDSTVMVDKGIVVDEKMRTTVPDIYAAGDVAESIDPYGGREIVPNWYNSAEQGRVAGSNLVGLDITCPHSPAVSVLKGAEPPIAAVGRLYRGVDYEVLSSSDPRRDVHEKVFVRDQRIEAYQAVGTTDKVGFMYDSIRGRKNIDGIKRDLRTRASGAVLLYHRETSGIVSMRAGGR